MNKNNNTGLIYTQNISVIKRGEENYDVHEIRRIRSKSVERIRKGLKSEQECAVYINSLFLLRDVDSYDVQ